MKDMLVKDGVIVSGVKTPILYAMWKAAPVMEPFGEYTVTSLLDGRHKANSLHYRGLAMDIRTRHMADGDKAEAVRQLKAALGPDYDVILEADHIHVEFDPPPAEGA